MASFDQPKILLLAGSTRSGSLNQLLADAYGAELLRADCQITRLSLTDYEMPIFNADLETGDGIPKAAIKLAGQFDAHQAMVLATPEYNGSIPPLLKNAIDWVSRVKTDNGKPIEPFKNKICAIAAASPGRMGGYTGACHLRDIMNRLGSLVIPELFALPFATKAFDEHNDIAEEKNAEMLKTACASLIEKTRRLS